MRTTFGGATPPRWEESLMRRVQQAHYLGNVSNRALEPAQSVTRIFRNAIAWKHAEEGALQGRAGYTPNEIAAVPTALRHSPVLARLSGPGSGKKPTRSRASGLSQRLHAFAHECRAPIDQAGVELHRVGACLDLLAGLLSGLDPAHADECDVGPQPRAQ